MAITSMTEPVSGAEGSAGGGPGRSLRDFFADGYASDQQLGSAAKVTLGEDAEGVAACFAAQFARGGADAAFEAVADHAGAATDIAFSDWAGAGTVEGLEDVLFLYMEAVDVVEEAIISLAYDGEGPEAAFEAVGRPRCLLARR